MSALRNKLDKATFRYEDVTVSLDGELASKRTALMEQLSDAASTPSGRMGLDPAAELRASLTEIDEELRGSLVTVRIRALDTDKWNALIIRHPARKDVALDSQKGYNILAVTKAAVEMNGFLVEDGKTEPVAADEWADLWANIDGGDFDRFWMAVTRLNETNGWNGVDYLKKGSTPTPGSSGT